MLEAINSAPAGLTATDVARRTRIPVATTHRILRNLQELGYLSWAKETKCYGIGFPLTLFGNRRLVIERLVKRARPHLRRLYQSAGLSVSLSSLDGPLLLIEERMCSPHMQKLLRPAGSRVPAHVHSAGKVLLSFLSVSDLRSLYADYHLAVPTRHSIRDLNLLLKELAGARRLRAASDDEECILGVRSHAVPLINPEGRAICALALEGRRADFGRDIEGSLKLLRNACDDIMRDLAKSSV